MELLDQISTVIQPLPLLEKGKYQEDQQIKLIYLKPNSDKDNNYGTENYIAPQNTRNYTQINFYIDEMDLFLVDFLKNTKTSSSSQKPKSQIKNDHNCILDPDTSRCNLCSSNMKFYYHGGECLLDSADIFFMDYTPVFQQQMDLQNANRVKQFLNLTSIQQMKEWVYFVSDRQSGLGLQDIIEQSNNKIPQTIRAKNVNEITRHPSYSQKIKIIGDHESSNIGFSSINKNNDYVMILLRSDSNTRGCLHWFMFTVQVNQPCEVKFSILNNKRTGILYKEGMSICVLDSTKTEKGWHRSGNQISYYKNNVDHIFYRQEDEMALGNLNQNGNSNVENVNIDRTFQSLDWTYNFTEQGQRVVFAYSYPFTFTDLIRYLEKLEELMVRKVIDGQDFDQENQTLRIKCEYVYYQQKIIGTSRLGLPIIVLKVTASRRANSIKQQQRKIVFIIARQHPGETPSSFVCNGFIDFILSDCVQSKVLRELFIFYVVPMVNPDGVVIGNSRCSLSGTDLNRKWINPDPVLQPEVYCVQEFMKKVSKQREIVIFCDLHGHSSKQSSFVYGCNKTNDQCGSSLWVRARLIPRIMARQTDMFSYDECRFRIQEDQISTARVVAWNDFKIVNSFTIETSFFGYNETANKNKPKHYSIEDLNQLGKTLALSILQYTIIVQKLQQEVSQNRGGILKLQQKNIHQNFGVGNNITNSNFNGVINRNKQKSTVPESFTGLNGRGGIHDFDSENINYIFKNNNSVNFSNLNSSNAYNNRNCSTPGQAIYGQGNLAKNGKINRKTATGLVISSHDFDANKGKLDENDKNKEKLAFFNAQMIHNVCPEAKSDWRQYFNKDQLEQIFQLLEDGVDPNDGESDCSGSDSEPEIDLFEQAQFHMLENQTAGIQQDQQEKQDEKKQSTSKAPWNPSIAVNSFIVTSINTKNILGGLNNIDQSQNLNNLKQNQGVTKNNLTKTHLDQNGAGESYQQRSAIDNPSDTLSPKKQSVLSNTDYQTNQNQRRPQSQINVLQNANNEDLPRPRKIFQEYEKTKRTNSQQPSKIKNSNQTNHNNYKIHTKNQDLNISDSDEERRYDYNFINNSSNINNNTTQLLNKQSIDIENLNNLINKPNSEMSSNANMQQNSDKFDLSNRGIKGMLAEYEVQRINDIKNDKISVNLKTEREVSPILDDQKRKTYQYDQIIESQKENTLYRENELNIRYKMLLRENQLQGLIMDQTPILKVKQRSKTNVIQSNFNIIKTGGSQKDQFQVSAYRGRDEIQYRNLNNQHHQNVIIEPNLIIQPNRPRSRFEQKNSPAVRNQQMRKGKIIIFNQLDSQKKGSYENLQKFHDTKSIIHTINSNIMSNSIYRPKNGSMYDNITTTGKSIPYSGGESQIANSNNNSINHQNKNLDNRFYKLSQTDFIGNILRDDQNNFLSNNSQVNQNPKSENCNIQLKNNNNSNNQYTLLINSRNQSPLDTRDFEENYIQRFQQVNLNRENNQIIKKNNQGDKKFLASNNNKFYQRESSPEYVFMGGIGREGKYQNQGMINEGNKTKGQLAAEIQFKATRLFDGERIVEAEKVLKVSEQVHKKHSKSGVDYNTEMDDGIVKNMYSDLSQKELEQQYDFNALDYQAYENQADKLSEEDQNGKKAESNLINYFNSTNIFEKKFNSFQGETGGLQIDLKDLEQKQQYNQINNQRSESSNSEYRNTNKLPKQFINN